MVQYIGEAGIGVGLLALDTNIIAGVEMLGGVLDDTYVHNPRTDVLEAENRLLLRSILSVPPPRAPSRCGDNWWW